MTNNCRYVWFVLLTVICHFFIVTGQEGNNQNDTLFHRYTESKDYRNEEFIITNRLILTVEVYTNKRFLVKSDSVFKPMRVVSGIKFERNPTLSMINSSTGVDLYSQVVWNIYQLYASKIRADLYKLVLRKDNDGNCREVISRHFRDMLEMEQMFRQECDYGKNEERMKYWNVLINKDLEKLENAKQY
jgi:hypothetical protein